MLINKLITNYGYNNPIFIEDILNIMNEYTRQRVYQLLNNIIKTKQIIRVDRGIYYIPNNIQTNNINDKILERKYIKYKDDIYGIYNINGNIKQIITNKETKNKTIQIDNNIIHIKPSRVQITKDNVHTYTLLELFNTIDITKNKNEIIKYIKDNNIQINNILKLAQYFPNKVLKQIITSNVLNEIDHN